MGYLKSALVGIAAAIVAVALFLAAMLGFVAWRFDTPESGMVAVIVRPDQVLLAAVVGFILGLWWSRSRRTPKLPA